MPFRPGQNHDASVLKSRITYAVGVRIVDTDTMFHLCSYPFPPAPHALPTMDGMACMSRLKRDIRSRTPNHFRGSSIVLFIILSGMLASKLYEEMGS